MILLQGRVFKLVLLLAIAATMPNVVKAQTQMSEIPLGSGSTTGGKTQSFDGGAALLDGGGDTGGGGLAAVSTNGPEAVTFDGTYVWVATQFNDSITRIRVSDGTVAGTFTVGKRPVALLSASGFVWVANLLGNSVMKITPQREPLRVLTPSPMVQVGWRLTALTSGSQTGTVTTSPN
jgi:hypothetical protein